MDRIQPTNESELFFRQWLRSPKSMGSVIPSSRALARAVAKQVVRRPGEAIVELGGGTGAISEGLLESGVPRDKLVIVELDGELHGYLKRRFDGVRVVRGDATRLNDILAQQGVDRVSTVVCGIPMVTMSPDFLRAIVEASFQAMGTDGMFLQYSYSPVPPIRARKLGFEMRLAHYVLWNIPPATVWRLRRP